MTKLSLRGLALILCVILMLTLAAPAMAQETTTVQVDGLLVFASPDVNSQLLAVLSLGVSVTRYPDQQQNGFTKVTLPDGREGWANFSTAGVAEGATSTATDGSGAPISGVVVQSQGNVRIRDAASLSGNRLGYIGWGETASLLAFDSTAKWIQINYNGLVGWASAEWFVVVSGDAGAVSGASPQTVTSLASAPLEVVASSTSSVASGTLIQAVGNVIIRDAASLQGNRVALAAWGTVLPLLETDAAGEWGKVDAGNGVVGWTALVWWRTVTGEVTTATTSETVTTTTTSVVATSEPAGSPTGVTVMALGNVRLRSAPNGERLASIPWGAILPVFGKTADGASLQVEYNGVAGWVAAEWFDVASGDLSTVPVK